MFTSCSWLGHYLFMTCSNYSYSLILSCLYNESWLVHDLLMSCSLCLGGVIFWLHKISCQKKFCQIQIHISNNLDILVHDLFKNCSLFVHFFSQFYNFLDLTSPWCVHILFTTFLWLVHYLFITCLWLVQNMLMTSLWLVHSQLMTF